MSAQLWRYEVVEIEGWMNERMEVGTVLVDRWHGKLGDWCFERRGEISYVTARLLNRSTGDPIADQVRYEESSAEVSG